MRIGPFTGAAWKQADHWGFWFRLFGYGLAVSTMDMLFSERMGYTSCWRIFGVKYVPLKPMAMPVITEET